MRIAVRRFWVGIVLAGSISCFSVYAQTNTELTGSIRAVQSRVEQMAHGYVTEVEWVILMDEIEALGSVAEEQGEAQATLEIDLIRARAKGYLRREWNQSLAILRGIRTQKRAQPLTGMNRVYLEEAAILARLGDTQAIATLIREFSESPYFDPQQYPWSGGEGPDSPLKVTRPRSSGSSSITVTAMERYRREAQYCVGSQPPSFEMEDLNGRRWTRDGLIGSVVVLDFRVAHTPADGVRRAHLERLAKRYGTKLVLLGICLNLSREDLRRNAAEDRTLQWSWIPRENAAELLKKLAIFGEAQMIVLDREGRIAARVRDGVILEQEVNRLFVNP